MATITNAGVPLAVMRSRTSGSILADSVLFRGASSIATMKWASKSESKQRYQKGAANSNSNSINSNNADHLPSLDAAIADMMGRQQQHQRLQQEVYEKQQLQLQLLQQQQQQQQQNVGYSQMV